MRSGRASGVPRAPVRTDDALAARTLALLRRAGRSTPQIRERLCRTVVIEHLGLAEAVANRYASRLVELADLRQVAYLGLTKAVNRFDPDLGDDLVAFAVPTISGEIKRFLRDTSWPVRPPRALLEFTFEVGGTIVELERALGRPPTLAETSSAVHRGPAAVEEAIACAQSRRSVSLDQPVPGSASDLPLGDLLESDEDGFARADSTLLLEPALRSLNGEERRIVQLRFGDELSQAQIAERIGVSQMQVSRLLARILDTLRAQLARTEPGD